jgi:hypothetical protein
MVKGTNCYPALDGGLQNVLLMGLDFIYSAAVSPFLRTLYDWRDIDFDSQRP